MREYREIPLDHGTMWLCIARGETDGQPVSVAWGNSLPHETGPYLFGFNHASGDAIEFMKSWDAWLTRQGLLRAPLSYELLTTGVPLGIALALGIAADAGIGVAIGLLGLAAAKLAGDAFFLRRWKSRQVAIIRARVLRASRLEG